MRKESAKCFRNTLIGSATINDFNDWKENDRPMFSGIKDQFTNSEILKYKILNQKEFLEIDKANFLIGSRFSYFNSKASLMLLPRID